MRPIQELHKAESVWLTTRTAKLEYDRTWEYIKRITSDDRKDDLPPLVRIGYNDITQFSTTVPNGLVAEMLKIHLKHLCDIIADGTDELKQLGYDYDPFNEENK